jgi:hypothetical protein
MVMVLQPVFMPDNLTIKLVHQLIHGSVQVRVRTLGEHVTALDVDIALRSLPSFLFLLILYRKQNLDIHDLIKMPDDPIQLGRNVVAQGRGNFEVMTADRQIHK